MAFTVPYWLKKSCTHKLIFDPDITAVTVITVNSLRKGMFLFLYIALGTWGESQYFAMQCYVSEAGAFMQCRSVCHFCEFCQNE